MEATGSGLQATLLQEVLLALHLSSLSIPSTTRGRVLQMMRRCQKPKGLDNSRGWSMYIRKHSLLMDLLVYIVVSFRLSLGLLFTADCISVSTTPWVRLPSFYGVSSDLSQEPVVLVGPLEDSFLVSFALGWSVTTAAGLASYPLDTLRCVTHSSPSSKQTKSS